MMNLYDPRPIGVRADSLGIPRSLSGVEVATVREEWLVEDRWWAAKPISRRYFELTLADGRCEVVFSERGHWYGQRA